uniref:Secreted protein n=1 Tax=Arundo donax TaxID=35708 RepID=A0A0A9CT72_ARUDO
MREGKWACWWAGPTSPFPSFSFFFFLFLFLPPPRCCLAVSHTAMALPYLASCMPRRLEGGESPHHALPP